MCGSIALYDHQGERMHTIYCSATPEYGKDKFKEKLGREIERVKATFPNVLYIGLADGAKDNWTFLENYTPRLVLDFYRCAMLPLSPDATETGHADDLSAIGTDLAAAPDPTAHWNAAAFRERIPGPHFYADIAGSVLPGTGDVVSNAPELARLTLNVAATHHDSRVGGQRLVYGGHTIGLALAQATRLLPNLATVLGWESCDHTGPVHEGDTLYSELHVDAADPLPDERGGVLTLRSLVYAVSADADEPDRQVLDWRFTALHF